MFSPIWSISPILFLPMVYKVVIVTSEICPERTEFLSSDAKGYIVAVMLPTKFQLSAFLAGCYCRVPCNSARICDQFRPIINSLLIPMAHFPWLFYPPWSLSEMMTQKSRQATHDGHRVGVTKKLYFKPLKFCVSLLL